jgi:hypothetical protein
MTPEMTEQVLGLTINEVVAYAAAANVGLVLVLALINTYYAWQANRQANASREQVAASNQQVAASNRQADAAQKTLDLLLEQSKQQERLDLSTVRFQLEAAIHMIDEWLERIGPATYSELPDVIEIRPTNFSNSIASADRIDGVVAMYMGAGLLYISAAETDIRVMRDQNPAQHASSHLAMHGALEAHKRFRDKAMNNLNVARFKLLEAKTRLSADTEDEQPSAVVTPKGEKGTP